MIEIYPPNEDFPCWAVQELCSPYDPAKRHVFQVIKCYDDLEIWEVAQLMGGN